MIICSIDTSGRDGSLALAHWEPGTTPASFESLQVLRFVPVAGGTYSAQLIPLLNRALDETKIRKTGIGLFAVASGPGSFTGLRVGLSTVKALGEAFGKPVVAISVLEAIAAGTGRTGAVIAALDAQRAEVYVGEYSLNPQSVWPVTPVHEALAAVDDFTASLRGRLPVATFTPDAAIQAKVQDAGAPVELVVRPGADQFARLGAMKFAAGLITPVEELDANYIRRSDAEIFSAPKPGSR
ncbi:MAG TPA: tRNA (adenosine(37)-N6)-threonylcarbamoyltransferase complex dimerization subunit type 1 TsaB [Clostridia bacterium]|nr:tRNA (adenosine(37)-N6)-threonylcarbamoyltransferase complex dimerization subunit type 1 TsaB [Clostridia bacterium]